MVSAWQVYWVMQLDSIGSNLVFVLCILFFAALAATIAAIVHGSADPSGLSGYFEEEAKRMLSKAPALKRLASKLILAFFVLLIVVTALPSSKTAAAMIILPAVTSDKVIDSAKGEVKELLGLTKDALRGLNPDNHKPKPADGK
jgi:hypothetical protein